MYKNKKAKGLTFLETMAAIAIISSVSLFFYIKINKINEKKDLDMAKKLIQNIFSKYSTESIYLKKRYKIEIHLVDKKIKIRDSMHKLIELIYLPKKLKYEVIYKNHGNITFLVETTINGNLSKAFTLYTCDYKDLAQSRIAFYTFQNERILKINSYINITAGNIKYENLSKYHYSNDGINRKGWLEE